MPFQPPSGWIETLSNYDESGEARSRFHQRRDCPRIHQPDALRAVDRPYSAPRCNLCAPDGTRPLARPGAA